MYCFRRSINPAKPVEPPQPAQPETGPTELHEYAEVDYGSMMDQRSKLSYQDKES